MKLINHFKKGAKVYTLKKDERGFYHIFINNTRLLSYVSQKNAINKFEELKK